MAITHPTAVRDTVCDTVVDLIDAASPTAGSLVFLTSGDVEVATLTFSDPAFGASSSGTATANAITDDTSATGGTVAKFEVQDGAGSPLPVFYGSVGVSGEDINSPDGVIIGAGDTVEVTSLTYSAMP